MTDLIKIMKNNHLTRIAIYFVCVACMLTSGTLEGQSFFTRTGHIQAASHTRYLDLVADNYQVAARVLPGEGKLRIDALIKSFEFDVKLTNKLMSGKGVDVIEYPKISYEGTFNPIDLTMAGRYTFPVTGILKAWNMERLTNATVTVEVDAAGKVEASATFDMVIEEQSVRKFNALMRQYLPSIIDVNADNLGIDRNILITAQLNLLPR